MSDVSTLEKIKESEDLYTKAIAEAKAKAESIILKAKAEAEIMIHDAIERATEQADSIKVEALKEAQAAADATLKEYKAKVSLIRSPKKDEVLSSFAEAVKEVLGL